MQQHNIIYLTHTRRPVMVNCTTHGLVTQKMIAPCVRAHSVGGRPKKQYKPGRPVSHPAHQARRTRHSTTVARLFYCPICKKIVDKPIELKTCGSLVCALQESQTTSCPCCQSEYIDDLEAMQPPSEITAFRSLHLRSCAVCAGNTDA